MTWPLNQLGMSCAGSCRWLEAISKSSFTFCRAAPILGWTVESVIMICSPETSHQDFCKLNYLRKYHYASLILSHFWTYRWQRVRQERLIIIWVSGTQSVQGVSDDFSSFWLSWRAEQQLSRSSVIQEWAVSLNFCTMWGLSLVGGEVETWYRNR